MFLFAERYLMYLSKMPESRAFREFRLKLEAAGEARGIVEGEVKGKRSALLTILLARGLRISAAQRRRITECSDAAKLDRWIARAVTAGSTTEVLAGPGRRARAA